MDNPVINLLRDYAKSTDEEAQLLDEQLNELGREIKALQAEYEEKSRRRAQVIYEHRAYVRVLDAQRF